MLVEKGTPDSLYQEASEAFGPALARLASAYEFDADLRRDLLQDIHFALWRSFSRYDKRCSLRSWVFQVAHNVATTHSERGKRHKRTVYVDLDDLADLPNEANPEQAVGDNKALAALQDLILKLKSPDKQIMLSYLEGMDLASIAEITGLSATAISSRIHRVKAVLAAHFQPGGKNAR